MGTFRDQRANNSNSRSENINQSISQSINQSNEQLVNQTVNANTPVNKVVYPINGFSNRITKKQFGQQITPQTSPVQPERFSGYHTAADAETTEAEQTSDVPVYSIAEGTVKLVRDVNGYGGVIMVQSEIEGETVTALYGHVRLSSISKKVGDSAAKGEQLGVLGTGFTEETDGERKHLHFGLVKGASTNLRGYATNQAELEAWLDPVEWLSEKIN